MNTKARIELKQGSQARSASEHKELLTKLITTNPCEFLTALEVNQSS